MDKVFTNRKAFLAACGSALFAGFAFGGKREPARSAKSEAPSAEKLPMQAVKAPRSVARGGNTA